MKMSLCFFYLLLWFEFPNTLRWMCSTWTRDASITHWVHKIQYAEINSLNILCFEHIKLMVLSYKKLLEFCSTKQISISKIKHLTKQNANFTTWKKIKFTEKSHKNRSKVHFKFGENLCPRKRLPWKRHILKLPIIHANFIFSLKTRLSKNS